MNKSNLDRLFSISTFFTAGLLFSVASKADDATSSSVEDVTAFSVKNGDWTNVPETSLTELNATVEALRQQSLKIDANDKLSKSNEQIIGKLNSRLKRVDGESSVSNDTTSFAGTTLQDQLNATTSTANNAASIASRAQNTANNAQGTANSVKETANRADTSSKYLAKMFSGTSSTWHGHLVRHNPWKTVATVNSPANGSMYVCVNIEMTYGSQWGGVRILKNGRQIASQNGKRTRARVCTNVGVGLGTNITAQARTNGGDSGDWTATYTYNY